MCYTNFLFALPPVLISHPNATKNKLFCEKKKKNEKILGVEFVDRSPGKVELEVAGKGRLTYSLILTIPFDSTRKRMSVIVQAPDGSYILYCKVMHIYIYIMHTYINIVQYSKSNAHD